MSLDLLSYLKSEQVTPFQIFNDVIMPNFQEHISNGNKSNNNTNNVEAQKIQGIQNDLIPIAVACGRFQELTLSCSYAIKQLAYQSLDDAFKERTEAKENNNSADVLLKKLNSTHSIVSELKKVVCTASDETSKPLETPLTSEESPHLKNDEMVASKEKIEEIYDGLDKKMKPCLLCFSMFPENAEIKKKVLIHWWVGEGFIDTLETVETAEETGNKFFEEFLKKGIVELFYKRSRPSADICKMQPAIRHAVIELAKSKSFFAFDGNDNPTEDFSCSKRACLVRTVEGSNVRELPFHSNQENVQSLINVSERHLYFRPNWFSKMKNVKVLQLGRWQRSVKHLIEVEDCEFLKGLKNMRELRYLSLRGVSRITELPASICKARNLRILNLNGCCDLEKLPRGIGSLKNLTHLDMYECYLISGMPKGLALLSKLQVLKGFVISTRSGSNDCKLEDLSKLEYLRKLSIHMDIKQAETKERELNSLAKFKMLRSLSVSWSRIYDKPATQTFKTIRRIAAKKLTRTKRITKVPSVSMAPEFQLEKLDLHYFPRSNMPEWLKPLLNNLKKLYIRGGSLSDLDHNGIECKWKVEIVRLKFLDKLEMEWRKLQDLFPKLRYLEIVKCPKLSFNNKVWKGVWKEEELEEVESSSSNA